MTDDARTSWNYPLPRATELAHFWIRERLVSSGIAIDATAGNGHDTAFLARVCGPDGSVHAIDVQAEAIERTRARLIQSDLRNVSLHQACHSQITKLFGVQLAGAVDAIMFNLGYLPGSDKSLITKAATTLPALQGALGLLAPGGIITVVLYGYHPGGAEETDAIVQFTRGLDQAVWQVAHYQFLNQRTRPPELIGIVMRS